MNTSATFTIAGQVLYSSRTKYLPDGSPNPNYTSDTRKRAGDRHITNQRGDRHTSTCDRHKHRDQRKKHFIAVDGEGIHQGKEPGKYTLLAASTGKYKHNNGEALSTLDCFNYLLELKAEYPRAIFVGFGTTYDVSMMLKDVPKEILERLWHGRNSTNRKGGVPWHAPDGHTYVLTYRPRKEFAIRRQSTWMPYQIRLRATYETASGQIETSECDITKYLTSDKQQNDAFIQLAKTALKTYWQAETDVNRVLVHTVSPGKNYDGQTIQIWDTFGFFQSAFVDALADKKNGYFKELVEHKMVGDEVHDVLVWPDGLEIDITDMRQMKKTAIPFSARAA